MPVEFHKNSTHAQYTVSPHDGNESNFRDPTQKSVAKYIPTPLGANDCCPQLLNSSRDKPNSDESHLFFITQYFGIINKGSISATFYTLSSIILQSCHSQQKHK